ncbi:hypothetical protein V2J09_021138 [Rumex salicifolius]
MLEFICIKNRQKDTSVSKLTVVMTPNPECATLDTSILDSLRLMYEGKFLHLPVMDGGVEIVYTIQVQEEEEEPQRQEFRATLKWKAML